MSGKRIGRQRDVLHTPEGVRDNYGEEYAAREKLISEITRVMHLYGYEDLQTPTFEFFDVFSNEIGTTPSAELYKFFDKEGHTLVLRPDFTPSVARCVAKYFADERRPLRFCYEGSAFSNTSSLQGKLNETTQLGAELMNDGSIEADAEMLAMLIESLLACGLQDFQVSVGNVEYFKGYCESFQMDPQIEAQLRDDLSGKNYFAAEDLLRDAEFTREQRDVFLRITDFMDDKEQLLAVKERTGNPRAQAAIDRLTGIYDLLCLYGYERYVSFDLSLLSRYHYYTGVIFKAYTYGAGDAIASGGRYDSLLEQFGKDTAATGYMISLDMLREAMRRQKIAIETPQKPVQITYTPDTYAAALKRAGQLRAQGVCAALVPESGEED